MSRKPPEITLPEAFCFWALALTWPFYALGALYIVGPVLAWSLVALAIFLFYLGPAIRIDLRANRVPGIVWCWIAGMTAMLLSLWIGHINWDLGLAVAIKSTVGWAKGWALLALFPLAGAALSIRRDVIIRAHSIVALCTLLVLPVMVIAPTIGLPEKLFTSPLQIVGGPGPEYFTVYLFTLDPATWTPRWQFYAPWSPFAGLLGVLSVLLAIEDRRPFWLAVGVLAGVAMIVLSASRMSFVALTVCVSVPRLMPYLKGSPAWNVLAGAAASMAVFGSKTLDLIDGSVNAFKGARADSTRVREALQRIAFDRWISESVWFGHGTVERGPHIVEFMPIGSHHTWFGLLFVKGIFGMFALLLPMAWQILITLIDAANGSRGRLPFAIMLLLFILTFGENLEIETYLLWPALLILGIHAREMAITSAIETSRVSQDVVQLPATT
jgi:hypothetical protein